MNRTALLLSFVVAIVAPIWLANCTSSANQAVAAKPAYPSDAATDPAGSESNALASAPLSSPDYLISARDIIEISVFQVPELTKTVQVSDDGNVTLPLIGKVGLAGKTTHDAEASIADKLRKRYLQSPQVSLFVKQYGQRVTVSGEVKTPRVLAVEGSLTLTQAVANAGGLSDLADPNRVHVAHAVGGRVHDQVYDYDAIQAGRANDPTLKGGDLVVAEQSNGRVVLKNLKDMLPFAVLASIM